MTESEAINRLRDHFRIHNDGRPTPHLNEAVSMAINALEKQIPKKPVFVHVLQDDDCGDNMCPSCKTGSVLDAYGNKPQYCHYCGQKLDWGD